MDDILFQHHCNKAAVGENLFIVIPPNTAVFAFILIALNTLFNLVIFVSLYAYFFYNCYHGSRTTTTVDI